MQFARANALAAYKSKSMADIGRVSLYLAFTVMNLVGLTGVQSAQQILHLQEEIKLHVEFCKEYGIEVEDIEKQEEHQGM